MKPCCSRFVTLGAGIEVSTTRLWPQHSPIHSFVPFFSSLVSLACTVLPTPFLMGVSNPMSPAADAKRSPPRNQQRSVTYVPVAFTQLGVTYVPAAFTQYGVTWLSASRIAIGIRKSKQFSASQRESSQSLQVGPSCPQVPTASPRTGIGRLETLWIVGMLGGCRGLSWFKPNWWYWSSLMQDTDAPVSTKA